MATFLLKTEPSTFSYADLCAKGPAGARWDGVTNAQALITLRTMATGDTALIYHTGTQKAIVGIATVLGPPYADPAKPAERHPPERHPPERQTPGPATPTDVPPAVAPKWAVIDLAAAPAPAGHPPYAPVTLAALRGDPRFARFQLLTHSRLSVMPVPAPLATLLLKMLRRG